MDDFPDLKAPYQSSFDLMPMSKMTKNNFNASVKVSVRDSYWAGELEFHNLEPAQRRAYYDFVIDQDGPVGEFIYRDHKHEQLGNWAGTPRVKGADQDGTALVIDGCAVNTLIAPKGDRFEIDNYLYHLTQDANSDSNGEVELRFKPALRKIPSDNALLVVINPGCKCMFADDVKPPTTKGKHRLADWRCTIRESIR